MGDLNHIILGPGGERVWTDDVGKAGAVQVSFRTGVPYVGAHPGDPRDGKPTTAFHLEIDETKEPNYAVIIPEYNSRGQAYVMATTMRGILDILPEEFKQLDAVVAESMVKAFQESGLGEMFRPLSLPNKISAEELTRIRKIAAEKVNNWMPKYADSGSSYGLPDKNN